MDGPAAAMAAPTLDTLPPAEATQGPRRLSKDNFVSLPPKLDAPAPLKRDFGSEPPKLEKAHSKKRNKLPPMPMCHITSNSLPPMPTDLAREDSCTTTHASVWRDYETTGKVLGTGGLSTHVLEAVHKVTGELVAIKTLEREKLSLRRRIDLNRELETQASLDHPHVARLKAAYKSKKHVRLVLEHLSGGAVSSVLDDRGLFKESEATLVVKQVLEAVKYLHRKGVVHRDIKVENIVYESRKQDKVKLIDLGLCTLWEKGMAPMTRVCGTPSCVAPEVLTECYTNKADMWCVGVVAHQLLTAEVPCMQHGIGKVFLSPRLVDCSPQAQKFVAGLLNVDHEARPSAEKALMHEWLGGRSCSIPEGTTCCGTIVHTVSETMPTGACSKSSFSGGSCSGDFAEAGYPRDSQEAQERTPGAEPAQPKSANRWRIPSVKFSGKNMSTMWAALRGTKGARVAPAMTQVVPGDA